MRKFNREALIQSPQQLRATVLIMVLTVTAVTGYQIKSRGGHASVTPPATSTISMCGVRRASDVELYTGPTIPDSPVSREVIKPNSKLDAFRLLPGSPDLWYLKNGSTIRIYNASTNAQVSSFTISGLPDMESDFAVGPDGGVYVISGLNDIYKFSNTGAQVWTRHINELFNGNIQSYGTGSGFRIAASIRSGGSKVWSADGTAQPNVPLEYGGSHYNAATNHIMWSSGQEVAVYDATTMARVFYMGTDLAANDPGPMHFYIGGGIEETGDGHYVVNDVNNGLKYFDSSGSYIGRINADTYVYPTGSIDYQYVSYGGSSNDILHYNGKYYLLTGATGNAVLSTLDDATLNLLVNAPQGSDFGLGIGAGAYTTATGNYFPAGTTPQVSLKFYPWWSSQAGQFTGQYSIRNIQQVKANQTVVPANFTIPANMTTTPGTVPVTLPTQAPGFYEMDVRLMKNGATVGADCLRYSIGASGQTLNLDTLPGGDAREVVLAAQFGQKLMRSKYNIENYLPDNPASTAPMDFSEIDADVAAATAAATQYGVMYEMQIATGGEKEAAHVAAGRWGARVQEWVAHFKTKGVKAYEAWNEPNNTYGDASDFTNKVLKPFYTGLKAADPTAIAVGGGILGVDVGYFQGIADAGGLNYMDVAGDHPYTGHNRSYEEQGQVQVLQGLKNFFAANGRPNMEIWNTESGFWNSQANAYYTQDDKLIRKLVLQQSLGMERYANFYNDGGYVVDGLPWALNGESTLTPAGLASVVYKQYVGTRQFLSWLPLGVPHTYAADYGPQGTDASHTVVVWADDYAVGIKPTLSGGGTLTLSDQWGQTSTLGSGSTLMLSGSVMYLKVPAGQTLTLTAAEAYGPNLARNTQGATATASSNAKNSDTPAYGFPSLAIDGIADTQGKGGNPEGISAWVQSATDTNPWLQVKLGAPRIINRVYVSSQGLGSVQTGLRSYDVQIDPGTGVFATVAQVRDQYFSRNKLVTFPAQTVSRIKLVNMSVNYSGYGDGLPPSWWPADYRTNEDVWAGQTTVYELEAYAPASGQTVIVADLNGDGKVNVFDLSLLLGNWGKSGKGDINSSGSVDIFDLSLLLANWTG